MRLILSLMFTAGVLLAGVPSSSAMVAPPQPAAHSHAVGVLEARDGCGRGYYRNRFGHCRPEYDRGYRDRDRGYRDRNRGYRDHYRDRGDRGRRDHYRH